MTLPQNLKDKTICVLGLGYVGLTLAVAMADRGFRVHGIEVRQEVLDKLHRGEAHFWEPRLNEKLQRVIASGHLSASREADASFGASVYIITVGTPLGGDGRVSVRSVEAAARQVGEVLRDDDLVILRSTVKIGTARRIVTPILEQSGKRFEIAVCPERTLEGRALIELTELPQIIGADTADIRARCAAIFGTMTPTTVLLSSLEAAELTKLVDNTYRDVMFGFANEIAKFCSQAGLDAAEVIRAGRLGYPRTNVALPGPVGGPCLEKDPHIFAESAESVGVDLAITRAARATNEQQPHESIAMLKAQAEKLPGFPEAPTISLLGLAFKGMPATDDLRGSMALPILKAIQQAFPTGRIRLFDPVVPPGMVRATFGLDPMESLADAFDGAHVAVIANNHMAFQSMEAAALARRMARPGIVYDYWNMHREEADSMPEGILYRGLGNEQMGA